MSDRREPAARACQTGALVALWSVAILLLERAYFDATYHVAFDNRAPWALGVSLVVLAGGYLVAWWSERRAARAGAAAPFGAARHALCWIVTALAASALTHVPPQDTIDALREEVPPTLGWLYPALVFVTPILLRRTARTVDEADQALVVHLALCSASGAALFLDPAIALALAIATLLLQLGAGGRLTRLGRPLAIAAALFVVWMLVATLASNNPLTARPSMRWVAAAALTAVAVAARPRDAAAWVRILAAPVAAATVIALCDVVLTARLAVWFGVSNALDTRLELFRQHPNFLASLYGFHAVLAVALIGVRSRARWFGAAAVCILLFATWHTDSNAGRAALLLGIAAIPVVWLLGLIARRVGDRIVVVTALSAIALATAGLIAAATGALGVDVLEGKVDRFRKSFEFRIAAWTNAIHVVSNHPVLGVGPHVFVAAEPFAAGTRFATEPTPPHPHNVPLYVAQSGGGPAFLAFLVWMGLLFWRLFVTFRRRAPDPIPPALTVGLLAACGGLFAANTLDLGLALDSVVPWPLWWASGLALAAAAPRVVAPARLGVALLVTAGLLALLVVTALPPMMARVEVDRARLLGADSARNPRLNPRPRQVAALERALSLDPSLEEAYTLLENAVMEDGYARLDVLDRYRRQAPDYGHVLGRVGRFHFENGNYEAAAETLSYARADRYWSGSLLEDRARQVQALGRLGRTDEAEVALRGALISNHEVVLLFPLDDEGRRVLEVFDETDELATTIDIGTQLDALRADFTTRADVTRRDWMQLYFAYRAAGLDDDAEGYLDFLEQNVAQIEPASILRERGRLALDRGDRGAAERIYLDAFELTGIESFRDFARQASGRTKRAVDTSIAHIGDLMAWQPAYELALDTRIEAAIASGALADAAEDMKLRLFFAKEPSERARQLVKLADALEASNASSREVVSRLRAAMDHLLCKPYTTKHLSVRFDESLPGRIATRLHAVWSAAGKSAAEIEREAIAWPRIRSVHPAALLFRLGLHRATGNAEALLSAAKLLQMIDPGCNAGFLAELTALEAIAPPQVIRSVARDRLLLRILHPPTEVAESPFGQAVLLVLNGAYGEAAAQLKEIFQKAPPGPETVRALEWWARACLLGGSVDEAGKLMRRAAKNAPNDVLIARRAEAWR